MATETVYLLWSRLKTDESSWVIDMIYVTEEAAKDSQLIESRDYSTHEFKVTSSPFMER